MKWNYNLRYNMTPEQIKDMLPKQLFTYKNGNASVSIYEDGTKIRLSMLTAKPEFPESMDIKITDYCDAGCVMCHEKSTRKGIHGNLETTLNLLKQLPAGVEIAIGGGNPLSHPDLYEFLRETHKHGIISSMTINEIHFNQERFTDIVKVLLGLDYIKGIGYSYSKQLPVFNHPNLVIHLILGINTIDDLEYLNKNGFKKVLLLGYKKFGRGKNYYDKNKISINANLQCWYNNLHRLSKDCQLSFDALAIDQLEPKRLFSNLADYDDRYMGDEGRFSMYLDAVKEQYTISSFTENRFDYTDDIREMFALVNKQVDKYF